MTNIISARLNKKEIEELNKIAKKEQIDRSALIRKFLINQIKEYKMKEMGEKYRKGIVSLAEAATMADVSIYEMMEYIEREKILPPALSKEEMEEQINKTREIFKNIYKEK
ncbi:MAG: UPF0175 family protein [Promethearchaeota archaeon]